MNKADLAQALAVKLNISKKQAEDTLEAWETLVIGALQKNEEVVLTGFGTFSARVRTARAGVNPRNPSERITVPEVRVPKFKAGKTLKDSLKQKTA